MLKILVADDDPIIRTLLSAWLRGTSHVILAADGYQTLQLARAERPDLIILDITMPAAQGFSVHDRLRSLSSLASVPVIYMSADASLESGALAAGGAAFLAKPFQKDALFQAVRGVIPDFSA